MDDLIERLRAEWNELMDITSLPSFNKAVSDWARKNVPVLIVGFADAKADYLECHQSKCEFFLQNIELTTEIERLRTQLAASEAARVELPRTPTPAMIAAGWRIVDAAKRSGGISRLGPGLGVSELWTAMYDAALADKLAI